MFTKTKLLRIIVLLNVALFLTLAAVPVNAQLTHALNSTSVTKIRVNGRNATVILFDGDTDTNGFLNASEDQTTGIQSLDFSYGTSHPTDPDLVIVFQGAGELPSTAITFTSTSAHFALTTPDSYFVRRCVVNIETGDFACAQGDPLTFDLTWDINSLGSFWERTKRIETFGPFTTKFQGEFTVLTATVNGTWTGESRELTGEDMTGDFTDTQNTTIFREITMRANP